MIKSSGTGISKRNQQAIEQRLIADLTTAVEANSAIADDRYADDDQLRGDPYWAGQRERWRGASLVVDPITRDHHTSTLARVTAVCRSNQIWTVSSAATDDELEAQQLEQWLQTKVEKYDLVVDVLYDVVYNCARHSYAYCYVGWRQKYITVVDTVYRGPDGEMVPEDQIIPGKTYTEVQIVTEELESEGLEFRVPHAADVVMWPPTCQDPKQALWVAERCEWSADQLVDGILDWGLDEDAVYELIQSGSNRDNKGSDAQRDKAEDRRTSEEPFTCWTVTGRCPLVLGENGRPLLDENSRRRDYVWVVCPELQKVLKFAPMPYRKRPWVLFQFLREPNRLIGDSVCSLVAPLQFEANLALRTDGDLRDLTMSPMLKVPAGEFDNLSRFSIYAGGMLPYEELNGPQSIVPLEMDKSGVEAARMAREELRERAGELFSAAATGTSIPSAQTAYETAVAAGGADDKFDLILSVLHRGLKDLAGVMISHYRKYMPADGEQVMAGGNALTMTPDILGKKFQISANGSSELANSTLQMERLAKVYDMVMKSPIMQQQLQRGDMTGAWALTDTILRRSGAIRDPKTIIGKQPQPPPNSDIVLQQIHQMLMQFAQPNAMAPQGDPAAQQMLQMMQQMMASSPAAQPAQPAQGAIQ